MRRGRNARAFLIQNTQKSWHRNKCQLFCVLCFCTFVLLYVTSVCLQWSDLDYIVELRVLFDLHGKLGKP